MTNPMLRRSQPTGGGLQIVRYPRFWSTSTARANGVSSAAAILSASRADTPKARNSNSAQSEPALRQLRCPCSTRNIAPKALVAITLIANGSCSGRKLKRPFAMPAETSLRGGPYHICRSIELFKPKRTINAPQSGSSCARRRVPHSTFLWLSGCFDTITETNFTPQLHSPRLVPDVNLNCTISHSFANTPNGGLGGNPGVLEPAAPITQQL